MKAAVVDRAGDGKDRGMQILADPLTEPFALPADAPARFREQGFVKLPGALDPGAIADHGAVIRDLVAQRARDLPPLERRGTYGKAFQQIMQLWQADARARAFTLSARLGRIAAELMGVRGVRLYHDQALFKEPGGGITPWHADQHYWPLASDRCCTAWIPLQETPLEMGPLEFAVGSQRCAFGRDLPIGDESERLLAQRLSDLPVERSPYALGEVSFHAGWTFHRAGANATTRMRAVMTVIYMDIDMRLAQPGNRNQENDRAENCPGIPVGAIIDSPVNPVIWSR